MSFQKDRYPKRRFILKIIGILLLVFPVKLLYSTVKNRLLFLQKSRKPVEISLDQIIGVTLFDRVIIVKSGNQYSVLSSRCSHLGCRINSIKNDVLFCPCHGSKFNLSGEILQGPASKNLVHLNFKLDHKNGKIIIEPPA